MGIDVSLALEEALSRLTTVPGVIVAALFVAAGVVEMVVSQTIANRLVDRMLEYFAASPRVTRRIREQYDANTFLDVGIGVELAAGIFLLVFVLVIAFRIVAIRVFAASNRDGFPTRAVKYRFFVSFLFVLLFEVLLVLTLIVLLVGPPFVVGALTGPGPNGGGGGVVLLLYILALGVLVALPLFLYFARQEMVLNDANTLAAMGRSRRITTDNMGAVFVLLALIFVVNVVGGLILGVALGSLAFTSLLTTIFSRVVSVFGIAVSTRAYLQIR